MKTIFLFELRQHLRKPSTYIYSMIFFSLSFLFTIIAGNTFPGATLTLGLPNRVHMNSPMALNLIMTYVAFFGILIVGPIMGQATYKDFHNQIHSLIFTTPVKKHQYLLGRFAGAFVVLTLIFSSIALAAWMGSIMPFVDPTMFGENRLSAFVVPYLTTILPNVLFFGAIFFAIALSTRKIFPVYVAGIMFFMAFLVGENFTGDIDNDLVAVLVDPFGIEALARHTRYWTVDEQNTKLIGLTGFVLYNRLLWLSVGFIAFAVAYHRFRFIHALPGSKRKAPEADGNVLPAATEIKLTKVEQNFSSAATWSLFRGLTWVNFRQIISSVYFQIIAGLAVLFMFVIGSQIGQVYDTETYPVTRMVLQLFRGNFGLFMLIIITFFSGELVWRERDAGMGQIYDALPIPSGVVYTSKLTAMLLMSAALMVVLMGCGVLSQTARGYFNYEFDLYFTELFLSQFPQYACLCVFAIFIHVIVNHKYVGHFFVILYFFASIAMPLMGWQHHLYRFNATPSLIYSDMNGYAHFVQPHLWFRLYWMAFCGILGVVSALFWVRGTETSFRLRRREFARRWDARYLGLTALTISAWLAIGAYVFYNTNILNHYRTPNDIEKLEARYEKEYREAYFRKPQPRLTAVYAEVDIYPYDREVRTRNKFTLVNKHEEAIQEIAFSLPRTARFKNGRFAMGFTPVIEDQELGFFVYKLDRPLQPGEEVQFDFETSFSTRGFKNNDADYQVTYNGTFFDNYFIMPAVGYQPALELSGERDRRDHGLPERPRMASIDDLDSHNDNYIAMGADWIDYETVVSTVPEQIALAPGYLQKEWTEGGRRFFHYKMDSKILNFFAYVSAEFEVARDQWEDVPIEVYYQKGHEYNVQGMIRGVKDSLTYFTREFSPYQHRQVRILEFPRYASFAQSFPNTIPFSEAIGFIAKVDENDPDDLDYPYNITAHEIAHQWWGHQVVGANVQGATVMSETMAEYSALMVMKERYGEDAIQRFLEHELNMYLSGRSQESREEQPLLFNENQPYIHYRKGALVMYALSDMIGEEKVNQALSSFLDEFAFSGPPYATAYDFYRHVAAVTPEEHQPFLEDIFKRIILHQHRSLEAVAKPLPDGRYEVTLKTESKKYQAKGTGAEEEIPVEGYWVDIGVFAANEKPLVVEKHKLEQAENSWTFVVDEKPVKAGIDPFNKLIDRIPDDNTVSVSLEP